MARRPSTPPPPRAANLSPDQLHDAIPILERRLKELESFSQITSTSFDELHSLYDKIEDSLTTVFGHNTIECERYGPQDIRFSIPMYMGFEASDQEKEEGLNRWHSETCRKLKTALEMLNEKLGDLSGSRAGAIRAYEGLEIHKDIARRATPLFKNGHYSHAVEDAVKALRDLVRLRSGSEEDGEPLMTSVFGGKEPALMFNDLASESGRNEQRGFMYLFAGAVAGLRNPRAHDFIQDDPERALEFIAFVSLLAKILESAKHRNE